MPPFTREYSREVEDAVATAFVDRNIRPLAHLLGLVERGELQPGLEAVKVKPATARGWIITFRKRRAGALASKVADAPDAVQILRRRLLSLADRELEVEERTKAGNADPERIRQIARAVREAAALPTKGDPRPIRPGDKTPGTQDQENGTTRGGLAGSILAAAQGKQHRSGGDAPSEPTHGAERGDTLVYSDGQSEHRAGATGS